MVNPIWTKICEQKLQKCRYCTLVYQATPIASATGDGKVAYFTTLISRWCGSCIPRREASNALCQIFAVDGRDSGNSWLWWLRKGGGQDDDNGSAGLKGVRGRKLSLFFPSWRGNSCVHTTKEKRNPELATLNEGGAYSVSGSYLGWNSTTLEQWLWCVLWAC